MPKQASNKSVVTTTTRTERKSKPKKSMTTSVSSRARARPTPRSNRVGGSALTQSYINAVASPFTSLPPLVGFGSLAPVNQSIAYYRGNSLTSNYDLQTIVLNPDACFSSIISAITPGLPVGRLGGFLTYTEKNTSTLATQNYCNSSLNQTSLVANFTTHRIVSAGLRIQVVSAMTATPGIISIKRFTGVKAANALDALVDCSVYPDADTFPVKAGGGTFTVNWLPSSPQDFSFGSGTDNGDGLYNPLAISLIGIPEYSRVMVEAVVHLECQTGSLGQAAYATNVGELEPSSSLVDAFPSIETMWNGVKTAITKLSLLGEVDMFAAAKTGYNVYKQISGVNSRWDRTAHRLLPSGTTVELLESKNTSSASVPEMMSPEPAPSTSRRSSLSLEALDILSDLDDDNSSQAHDYRKRLEGLISEYHLKQRKGF